MPASTIRSVLSKKKKIRETVPVSDATTGGDHLFTIRLMTPPALMTATCRCRRCRRRRCRRFGIFRRRVDDIAGRPQTLLEFQQLTHEVQIRTDDWTRALHQLVRLHHRQALVSHYVGDCNRRAARHAGLTMYQHATSGFPRFLWNTKTNCTMIIYFLLFWLSQRLLMFLKWNFAETLESPRDKNRRNYLTVSEKVYN